MLSGCSTSSKITQTPTVPETTAQIVVTEETTIPTESVIIEPKVMYGRSSYYINGYVYASELGAPVLGEESVSKLFSAGDLNAASEQITNIGDALYYLDNNGKFGLPNEACNLFSFLIAGDYESVGLIHFYFNDNYYCITYVEHNGMYYPFDPFSDSPAWLFKPENDCFSNSDLNLLTEKLVAAFPHPGTELTSIEISENVDKPHGAKVFYYADTTIPVDLGKPQLSDEEIDALILEQDYSKTAATINTLADAINYYKRAGFTFYDKRNNNRHGKFNYVQSACQVLKSNEGQCVSMSNLNHFLLHDNYDEVGYVSVRSPGDGHVMTYILQDGKYYLINSVDYTLDHNYLWLDSYPNVLGCAEDFQDIADSLVEHMKLGDGKLVNHVHLVKSPGDFVQGEGGRYYPKGCEVIPYYGIKKITYFEAGYEWDTQTRIDY